MAETYFGPDFHLVAPSRFGYFGSTPPRRASPADQADVYATLLDATPEEQATIDQVCDSIFPMRPRRRGAAFDALISNRAVIDYPLESIAVPTLLVHAPDDAYGG
jgi:pimeloyl-ACP methyl ester carboxylesterase